MYPLTIERLTLYDVAEHWSRMPHQPPATEIFDKFLVDFWRGEILTCIGIESDNHYDVRQRILDACVLGSHPGILFISDGEPDPSDNVEYAEDDPGIDLRRRVRWPLDFDQDKSKLLSAAYESMSLTRFDDFNDLIKPVLASLEVSRDDFAAYCQMNGFEAPKFWFHPRRAAKLTSEAAARRWLRAMALGAKTMSKKQYYERRPSDCTGLSWNQFAELWAAIMPEAFKRHGRPKNPPKKSDD